MKRASGSGVNNGRKAGPVSRTKSLNAIVAGHTRRLHAVQLDVSRGRRVAGEARSHGLLASGRSRQPTCDARRPAVGYFLYVLCCCVNRSPQHGFTAMFAITINAHNTNTISIASKREKNCSHKNHTSRQHVGPDRSLRFRLHPSDPSGRIRSLRSSGPPMVAQASTVDRRPVTVHVSTVEAVCAVDR